MPSFLLSRRSLDNPFDTGVNLTVDASGWPTSLPPNTIAHKLTVRDVQLHAMPGRYVVLYDGDGTLDFEFDSQVCSWLVLWLVCSAGLALDGWLVGWLAGTPHQAAAAVAGSFCGQGPHGD